MALASSSEPTSSDSEGASASLFRLSLTQYFQQRPLEDVLRERAANIFRRGTVACAGELHRLLVSIESALLSFFAVESALPLVVELELQLCRLLESLRGFFLDFLRLRDLRSIQILERFCAALLRAR